MRSVLSVEMSNKFGVNKNLRGNQSNRQEDIHDEELNHSKGIRKQLLNVTEENEELLQEVQKLKKSNQETKAEIELLKRMILQQSPGPVGGVGVGVGAQNTERTSFAKLPKVAESVSEITTFSQSCYDKILKFSFGPGQPDRKLSLAFTRSNNYYQLKVLTVFTEMEHMACLNKCDYFIHICAVKDGRSTDDTLWFQITSNGRIVKSSRGYVTLKVETDAIKLVVGGNDFEVDKGASPQINITVSMSLFYYDSTDSSEGSISTPLTSQETRTQNLLDLKRHLQPTVKIFNQLKFVPDAPAIPEKTLLDSGSPILKIDLLSEKPFYRVGIYFSLSQKAIDAFCHWVYGMDTGAFVYDVELNMELLLFATKFWICDLVKFSIDNICQSFTKNFTLEFLRKVWQFDEQHKIRNLEESLLEVIKTKAKINVDTERGGSTVTCRGLEELQ